jgi:hypothetical protein
MPRFLTKSRFILGNSCPTKLFYTSKPIYANKNQDDDFLRGLAEGGMVVGELSKQYFQNGHTVRSLGCAEAINETDELLKKDSVVIFEAAIAFENLFCRVDILVKKGNELQLFEVKAKSIDGSENDPFRSAKGVVRSEWRKYLLDIAFQRYVLQNAFPDSHVTSWLMCVDKTQKCTVNGLYQLFELKKDGSRIFCNFVEDKDGAICRDILTKRKVDEYIDELCAGTFKDHDFASYVRWLAGNYENDTKIDPEIGIHCKSCEFRCTAEQRAQGFHDGFRECWKQVLGWSDADFERPTVFDLYDFRSAEALIANRRIALDELTENDFDIDTDNKPGLHPKKMQFVRWEKLQSGEEFIDNAGLQQVMNTWRFPLHFIDFETAAPSVPLHRGLRPYQSLAFQFSHHTLDKDGKICHAGEYLNLTPGTFPNFDFLRSLMDSLSGDDGTIFRYASHENTIINHLIEQLDTFGQEENDYIQLRDFACLISRPTETQRNTRAPGDRDMVDLRSLVARHYYHPRMKGSQSIKYVLPAVLTGSNFLRQKYSLPSYGYEVDPQSSRNFSKQAWIQFDGDAVIDPYKLLPNVFDDIDKDSWDDLWVDEDIRGGGAAMAAYLRLQHNKFPQDYRDTVANGLLRYCELDTLAMVMIVEAWRNPT